MASYWFASLTGSQPQHNMPANMIVKDIHPALLAGHLRDVYGVVTFYEKVTEEIALGSGLPILTKEQAIQDLRSRLDHFYPDGRFPARFGKALAALDELYSY